MKKALKKVLTIYLCILLFSGLVGLSLFGVEKSGVLIPNKYAITGTIDPNTAERFKQYILKKDKGDKVLIHIESFGGYVISMHKFKYYLKHTKAKTVCYVDSHAASAGANIFMTCDEKWMAPKAMLLFHVAQICEQSTMFGCIKYRPVSPTFHPDIYEESIKELEEVTGDLLTAEEWKRLKNSEDVTIQGKDFMKRQKNPIKAPMFDK